MNEPSGQTDPSEVATPEITTVGPDMAVIHIGARARRYDDLAPASDHDLDGVAIRTLDAPPGPLLCRIATVNDVHFGETECGVVEGAEDTIGPILRSGPGEDPYPLTMNQAAVAEMAAIDPVAVLAKGDLTTDGTIEEYRAFLDTYVPAFGDRLHHVRGNHDAYRGQTFAAEPFQRIEVPGATLALLDKLEDGSS